MLTVRKSDGDKKSATLSKRALEAAIRVAGTFKLQWMAASDSTVIAVKVSSDSVSVSVKLSELVELETVGSVDWDKYTDVVSSRWQQLRWAAKGISRRQLAAALVVVDVIGSMMPGLVRDWQKEED